MKLCLGLATAACLTLPVLAYAQPVTGPYVGLGAGTSIVLPTNFDFEKYGVTGKTQYRPDYAGDAYIGFGLGNGFRIQLDGTYARNTAHSSDLGDAFGDTATVKTVGSEKKYGAMVNVLYDIPIGLPIFPYVGAGAGYQFVKYGRDLTAGEDGTDVKVGGTKGSVAYDVIGGVAYPIDAVPGLSLTAEYRFMQLVQSRPFTGGIVTGDDSVSAGKVKVGQESSHTFLLGLRYALFQPPPPAPAPTPAPAPVAAPAPAPAKTYLVFFDWDKYSLTPRALNIISQAASDSKTAQTTTINVSGYTDTSGTPKYNEGLSWRRAKAVAAQLVADGVPASEIQAKGFGDTHLLVPTGPGVREPQNRRVEIVLQ